MLNKHKALRCRFELTAYYYALSYTQFLKILPDQFSDFFNLFGQEQKNYKRWENCYSKNSQNEYNRVL